MTDSISGLDPLILLLLALVLDAYLGEARFLFRWTGIKWYDSYEEIQAIQDFIDWCENERIEVEGKEVDANEYYRFVRIGEEMDDNESQGWGFDIHIERTATY